MRVLFRIALSIFPPLLLIACDQASEPARESEEAAASGISISDAWARETVEGAPTGAIYMTIENSGSEPDQLLSADVGIAARAELHGHSHEDGMMRMRPVEAFEIKAGETASLAPGGMHLMLFGLNRPLVAGETFPLALQFEKAGRRETTVTIRAMNAGD